jgi:SAM-dependent methyltransferase
VTSKKNSRTDPGISTAPGDAITFSFGQNWREFLSSITAEQIQSAAEDIQFWLGTDGVQGKSVADIGSGSGIHSFAFSQLGARQVVSFDLDLRSVEATRILWEKAGRPGHWSVLQGSVLDQAFVADLGSFDLVYAWGSLHHTGALWRALENACSLVQRSGGILWISLYAQGPNYQKHLALKKRYNAATDLGKRLMIGAQIARYILFVRLRHLKNPFSWNKKKERGMSEYHDIVDWLGGLPYEVASEDEVLRFARSRGFILERIKVSGEGACNNYVFSAP